MRAAYLLRLSWGAALLARPGAVLAAAGVPADPTLTAVARVLGARHLLQAVVAGPGAPLVLRRAGAAVDVLHVGTCVAAAVALPARRRAAAADGIVETVLAATAVAAAGRAGRT